MPVTVTFGLIELPCPVWGAGRLSISFLGGIYLCYPPLALQRRLLAGLGDTSAPWSYSHPLPGVGSA